MVVGFLTKAGKPEGKGWNIEGKRAGLKGFRRMEKNKKI